MTIEAHEIKIYVFIKIGFFRKFLIYFYLNSQDI